jgi:hypothetical protein
MPAAREHLVGDYALRLGHLGDTRPGSSIKCPIIALTPKGPFRRKLVFYPKVRDGHVRGFCQLLFAEFGPMSHSKEGDYLIATRTVFRKDYV